MRSTISLLVFIVSISSAFSQRITFDDPDLTFSFKKPKGWEVFDNGYVVKISPSAVDTADIYFTITYFESPTPIGSFREIIDTPFPDKPLEEAAPQRIVNIGQYQLRMESRDAIKEETSFIQQKYQFDHLGQSWEITTFAPEPKAPKLHKLFKRMIKSLRINQ
ncbi:hypothetical protein AAOE16_06000 [Ekhidna sp. MALMAid0563]|uniref:hypothetical protein n=1 Tax=Ekhidna sp. MALMAid0563 TaxID=3143937 RepID=UPI0032DF960B